MKTIIFVFIAFLQSMVLYSQNFQKNYDSGYGYNDNGGAISLTQDGYLLTSATLCKDSINQTYFCNALIKTDFDGEKQWVKFNHDYPNGLSIVDIIPLPDGYIGTGYNAIINGYEPIVIRFNLVGEKLWLKAYPSPERISSIEIKPLPDGNFIVYGGGQLADSLSHISLMKIDQDGNELWTKIINTGYPQNYGGNFHIMPNGDMVLGYEGSYVGNLDDEAAITRTDSLGNTLWTKAYNTQHYSNCPKALVIPLQNGGFVLQNCIDTSNFFFNLPAKLFAADSLGNLKWTYTFPITFHELYSTKVASNGDIIGCGRKSFTGPNLDDTYGWLFRMTQDGELLWQRAYKPIYGNDPGSWLNELTETPDGGIAAVGFTSDTLDGKQNTDVWLLKVGPDGCFEPGCTGTVILSDVNEEGGTLVSEREARPRVHPNPATHQVTVSLPFTPLGQPATFHLHDALGREVARAVLPTGQQEAQVGLTGVAPGLYFWRLETAEGSLGSGKLIVIK